MRVLPMGDTIEKYKQDWYVTYWFPELDYFSDMWCEITRVVWDEYPY